MKPGTTRRGGFDWPQVRSIEDVEKLKEETLAARMAALGAALEGPELLALVETADSAAEAAQALDAGRDLRLVGYQRDWLVALLEVFWTRRLPERLPLEAVHERLHLGYSALEEGDASTAVELWEGVWKQLDALAARRGLDDPSQLEGVLGHHHTLFDWLGDFEDALLEADDEPELAARQIALGEQVLARFGGKDESLDRLAIWLTAFGHFDGGDAARARALIEGRLATDATWGEGWRGLSLLDTRPADHEPTGKDLEKAEATLRAGLAVAGVDQKESLYEALEDLLEGQDRWEDAAAVHTAWENDDEAAPPGSEDEEDGEDVDGFDDDEDDEGFEEDEEDLEDEDDEEEDEDDLEEADEDEDGGTEPEPGPKTPPKPGPGKPGPTRH